MPRKRSERPIAAGAWVPSGQSARSVFTRPRTLGALQRGDCWLRTTARWPRARLMRAHGAEAKYFHKMIGGNFRLAPLHAALLSVKLPHLARYSEARLQNACYYTTRLRELKGVAEDGEL